MKKKILRFDKEDGVYWSGGLREMVIGDNAVLLAGREGYEKMRGISCCYLEKRMRVWCFV